MEVRFCLNAPGSLALVSDPRINTDLVFRLEQSGWHLKTRIPYQHWDKIDKILQQVNLQWLAYLDSLIVTDAEVPQ